MRCAWGAAAISLFIGCDYVFPLKAPEAVATQVDAPSPTVDAPLDGSTDAGLDALFACPATYNQPFNGHVYRFEPANKQWLQAANDCADDETGDGFHRTHLAVLGNEQERSGVQALAPQQTLWIGLTDIVQEGTFRWVTAETTLGYPPPVGVMWTHGMNDGDGNCVLYVGDAQLDDRDCTETHSFVCECDANANVPSRYGQ